MTGGYSQQDVQDLAQGLTGVGVNVGDSPRLKPELQRFYRNGAFEHNPAKHNFRSKKLLGHSIEGNGYTEFEEAVSLMVRQPACSWFISRELAIYNRRRQSTRAVGRSNGANFHANPR